MRNNQHTVLRLVALAFALVLTGAAQVFSQDTPSDGGAGGGARNPER